MDNSIYGVPYMQDHEMELVEALLLSIEDKLTKISDGLVDIDDDETINAELVIEYLYEVRNRLNTICNHINNAVPTSNYVESTEFNVVDFLDNLSEENRKKAWNLMKEEDGYARIITFAKKYQKD